MTTIADGSLPAEDGAGLMTPADRRKAWRMVALVTVIHNSSAALAFSSFGVSVLAIEKEFGGNREGSSLAIASMMMMMLVVSPLAARLIERLPLRWVMSAGVTLAALGYFLASVSRSMTEVIACYGLLIGPGAALFGPLACYTLVTRWMRGGKQGRALGAINMPIYAVGAPLLLRPMIEDFGIRSVLAGLSVYVLLMIPLIWLLRERPPYEPAKVAPGHMQEGEPLPVRTILTGAMFWLIAVGYGVLSGAGAMKGAHFVPLLIDQGHTMKEATLLLSLSGAAGLVGALAFGWLADRIGAARALAVNCVLQAVTWSILLLPLTMPPLIVDALIAGTCSAGILAPYGALLVTIYGLPSYARAYGMTTVATMPFVFGITPLAGWLYVRTGSYHVPFAIVITALVVCAGLMVLLHGLRRRYPAERDEAQAPFRESTEPA